MINMVRKPVNLPKILGFLHYGKQIDNAWFLVAPFLPLREISNNARSRKITQSYKQINDSINSSDINTKGTLNAKFKALSYTQLTLTSNGENKGFWKTN